MSREALDRAGGRRWLAPPGGCGRTRRRSVSTAPVTPGSRCRADGPVAWAIGRALQGSRIVVCRPRFQLGAGMASWPPRARHEPDTRPDRRAVRPVPVVLVGHSMGRAPCCAPRAPRGDGGGRVAPGCRPESQWTSWRGAGPARARDRRSHYPLLKPGPTRNGPGWSRTCTDRGTGSEHALLRRAGLWHRMAADFCRDLRHARGDGSGDRRFQAADGNGSTVL